MKVLHVFKDYFPPTRGGVEQHVHEVVHSIDGFEFAVLTSSRSRRLSIDNDNDVRVIRAPEYARLASTPITPSWRKLLRNSGADLFHFHMPNPFGEMAFVAARTWTPMVATYHADIVGRRAALPFFRPFQQRFLRMARRIVVSNPRLMETATALAEHRDRAVVIPFGVDPDYFARRPPKADEIRAAHEGPIVLFLGRLVYYKGVEVLIEAIASVEATLVIVGDGPKRQEYEAEAMRHRVKRRVVFVGEVPDAERPAYYHAADVFVLPATSQAEAFGIAMLEAMACGTPVISTELGTGTSWVNLDRETGLVVPPRAPGALAGAIQALLLDEPTRRAMGEAGAARAREHFTRNEMLDALAELYRAI